MDTTLAAVAADTLAAAGEAAAMPTWLFVVMVVGFLIAIVAVGLIVVFAVGGKTNPAYRRLNDYVADPVHEKKREVYSLEDELEGTFYQRAIEPIINRLAAKFTKNEKQSSSSKLQDLLIAAGNPGNLGPSEFKAVQLLCAMISITGVVILGLLVGFVSGMEAKNILALTLGGMAVAGGFSFIIPQFYLKKRISERMKGIAKGLPDAIDLLVVSVEAGLGFDMALAKVVEKSTGPLADEFERSLEEMRLGYPRAQALKNIAKRVTLDDLQSFISAIIQADQLGASIGTVLRIQSEGMRVKRRQRVEETAMKAPIKMLFPMVLFIFPTIFIVVLGPIVLKVKYEKAHIGERLAAENAAKAKPATPPAAP